MDEGAGRTEERTPSIIHRPREGLFRARDLPYLRADAADLEARGGRGPHELLLRRGPRRIPHRERGALHPRAYTAAHLGYPFGTRLDVTSLDTSTTAYVTVNDRGPYVAGLALDLSCGAMAGLGLALG